MSTAKFDTLSNLAGTQSVPVATVAQGSAKAWVNFNGTGTVAIRASFNVSSITDNGTGNYTVNFTTAMPDANYSILGMGQFPTVFNNVDGLVAIFRNNSAPLTTSSAQISTGSTNNSFFDFPFVCVSVFR